MTHTEHRPFACSNCDKWFHKVVIWTSMRLPTQERSILLVTIVKVIYTNWQFEKPWDDPYRREINLLVTNVKSHLHKVVIWKSMEGSTQEKSHLLVPNVTRHLQTKVQSTPPIVHNLVSSKLCTIGGLCTTGGLLYKQYFWSTFTYWVYYTWLCIP